MNPTETTYGVAIMTLISVRANPDHRSELLTQILFGETFEILNQWNDWLNIRTDPDNLEGWIPDLGHTRLDASRSSRHPELRVINQKTIYVKSLQLSDHPIPVLPGSSLPVEPKVGLHFHLGKSQFHFCEPLPPPLDESRHKSLDTLTRIFINVPFLWGGRSLYGLDNARLIQLVFKLYGRNVPGDLNELVKIGKAVPFAHDSQPGDIAFFENKNGDIVHSGIITQPGKIIHCYGIVREDPIDHAGIYGIQEDRYIFYLRIIKRILS